MDTYALELFNLYEGIKHTPHTLFQLNSTVVLSVHPEVEAFRAKRAWTLLNKHGQFFHHPEFNRDYQAYNPNVRCYDNAARMSIEQNLIYCEGLMVCQALDGQTVELSHGWCCDKYGTVIDPTCARYQHIPQITYVGVPIRREYMLNWHKYAGYHGMLDGHREGYEFGIHYDNPYSFIQTLSKKEMAA